MAATAAVASSPYNIVPNAAVGVGLNKYTITDASRTLTVGPAFLTVSANNRSKTYGQTGVLAGTEFTSSGLLNSDHLSLSVAARLSEGTASMKSREELLRESAGNPPGMAEYAFQLQEQLRAKDQALGEKEQLLAATHQELAQRQQELARQEQLLAEARAYIAELKRQLFGPKADKLTPEQEEQLRQLTGDLREQAQRPAPLSQDVLEPERPAKDKEKLRREARRRRHPLPVQLEVQQVVLEPENKVCGHCHQEGRRISDPLARGDHSRREPGRGQPCHWRKLCLKLRGGGGVSNSWEPACI